MAEHYFKLFSQTLYFWATLYIPTQVWHFYHRVCHLWQEIIGNTRSSGSSVHFQFIESSAWDVVKSILVAKIPYEKATSGKNMTFCWQQKEKRWSLSISRLMYQLYPLELLRIFIFVIKHNFAFQCQISVRMQLQHS